MSGRIHIGSYLFHYPHSCGTTFAARGLSRALARNGFEATLYCCGQEHARIEAENREVPNRRVRCFEAQRSMHPFYVPGALLKRLCRNDDGIDILLIHGNFNPHNIAVAIAAKSGGIPYIVCPSGLYHAEMFRKNRVRKAIYGVLFERPMLRFATAIQVFADTEFNALARYGITRQPMFMVPNGFDPDEIPAPEPGEMVEPGDPSRTPSVIYLGRMDMHTKGLDLLVQAIALGIRNGRLPADLCIRCTGPDWGDKRALEELAESLGVKQNIRFFGPVGDRERWSVIFGCDLMVLASRHDSYPTTIIEAMAAGKPVLVSDQTGVSRLVERAKCGLLMYPDAVSICDTLAQALARRNEWRSMGERGRATAYSELTWQHIAY